jgi:large subunit ribosomal protein L30
MLKVTLTRSTIGCSERQRNAIRGLGLRKIGVSRDVENTPAIRGLIKSVIHLIQVEGPSEG